MLSSGYECPTGTHGFYDAPADYMEYLGNIGVDSREHSCSLCMRRSFPYVAARSKRIYRLKSHNLPAPFANANPAFVEGDGWAITEPHPDV